VLQPSVRIYTQAKTNVGMKIEFDRKMDSNISATGPL